MHGKSLDTKEDLKNKLKEIAPHIFNEDKIDWEKLKSTFGDDINFSDERYVLNWAGKSDAFRAIQTQTTATLIPNKKESVNFDETDNIFIEGENLEVLKVLQKAYYGKIKMIYIDPPYNTGNDFIYKDKFAENRNEYLLRSGEKDEEGLLTGENLYRKNSKESGHYHSNWLTMMYPRLFLARNLLRDDGVIFVSIDDNEVHNLRMIMNEIFGEENFVGLFIINSSPSAIDYGHIAKMHDYAVFYAKNIDETITNQLTEKNKKFKYSDEIGSFNLYPLYNGNVAFNPKTRPNLYYPFYLNPSNKIDNVFYEIGLEKKNGWVEVFPVVSKKDEIQRVWRWGKTKARKELNREIIGYQTESGEFRVVQKTRHTGKVIRSLQTDKDISSRRGTGEVEKVFGSKVFSFPKPIDLIKRFCCVGMSNKDIVLDFFAGSCPTAHAVLDLNKEDNGNRKFIMVQLPEKTDEKSEAYKAGFETIADIGKERIRRVIKKIKSEPRINTNKHEKEQIELFSDKSNISDNSSKFVVSKQDLGLKVFKLQESNFKIWRGDKFETGEELEEQLNYFVNTIKEEATEENMLYELLLKSGIDLNCKIEKKSPLERGATSVVGCVNSHSEADILHKADVCYYLINENELVIALSKINEDIVKNIIKTKPLKVITLDKLFEGNDQLKTNTILQMKDAGIEFKTI